MLFTLLIFIITMLILVTVHEFGHCIIAKWCGVDVQRFSIGFGKKLCSFKSSAGIEYVISIIPLGGYVKMLDSRVDDIRANHHRAFNHKNIWQRLAIIIAGPLFNFILSVILYSIVFQLGVVNLAPKVESVIPNSLASKLNITDNAELNSISGIKVSNWNDVNQALLGQLGCDFIVVEYTDSNNKNHKEEVSSSNWSFDLDSKSPVDAFGFVPQKAKALPVINKIAKDSPAELAGLKKGDEILAYNNKKYDNWADFNQTIKKGDPLTLLIERSGTKLTVNVTPKLIKNEQDEPTYIIGIYPASNAIIVQYGIVDALIKGIDLTIKTIKLVINSIYQLISGVISLKYLSGPISIAKGASQSADFGVTTYLYFLSYISISLGVVNLLPLPVLDGGHILMLITEKIKGSPLSSSKQQWLYGVGFLIILSIMMLALFNDLFKVISSSW